MGDATELAREAFLVAKAGLVPAGRPREVASPSGIDQFRIVIAKQERGVVAPTIAPSFRTRSLTKPQGTSRGFRNHSKQHSGERRLRPLLPVPSTTDPRRGRDFRSCRSVACSGLPPRQAPRPRRLAGCRPPP